ncbi:hypothetical protein GCM10027615_53420 [Plantactinospora veratri]
MPLALLLTGIVEIAVFVLLGRWIGFGWTLLLVLAASLLGLALLRREGMRAWRGCGPPSRVAGRRAARSATGWWGCSRGCCWRFPACSPGRPGCC